MNKHYLFSYGTLQQPDVQLANFGRLLTGSPDTLAGYRVDMVEITDPKVLAQSGAAFHPILRFSGNASDRITGSVFAVTDVEIEQSDRYEVDDYQRISVTLASGLTAYVYVERNSKTNQD